MSLILILRQPVVQNFLSHYTTEWLTRYIGTKVTVGSIHLSIRGAISISELDVRDHEDGDLFHVERLEVSLRSFSVRNRTIRLQRLAIHQPSLQIIRRADQELTNLDQVIRRIIPPDTLTADQQSAKPWNARARILQLHNAFIRFRDEHYPVKDHPGIDFNNLALSIHSLDIRDLTNAHDTLRFTVRQISAVDQSGFFLKSFEGNVQFSPSFLECKQLLTEINNSLINADIRLEYPDLGAFGDFIQRVRFSGNFRPTVINLSDIGYFAPVMFSMTNQVELKGDISGTVNHLKAERLELTYGRNTSFVGNLTIRGLPKIDTTFIQADIRQLITDAGDIQSFALPAGNKQIHLPDPLTKAGVITMSGNFRGSYSSFAARMNIRSQVGTIQTQLQVRTPPGSGLTYYNGKIAASKLNLGKLFDQENNLGYTSFDLTVSGSGLSLNSLDITASGLIKSILFKGYDYKNITIDGSLVQQRFTGEITIQDENIDLYINGLADLNREKPEFDLLAEIHHADLYRLKLTTRDTVAILSAGLWINFSGLQPDDIIGFIRLNNLSYRESTGSVKMDHLSLESFITPDSLRKVMIASDILDAHFQGQFQPVKIAEVLNHYLAGYSKVFFKDPSRSTQDSKPQTLQFGITLHKPENLTRLFIPEIQIAPETSLSGYFSSELPAHRLEIHCDSLRVSSMKFNNLKVSSTSDLNNIYVQVAVDNYFLVPPNDLTHQGLGLENLQLNTTYQNDTLSYVLAWDSFTTSSIINPGEIEGLITFLSPQHFFHRFICFDVLLDEKYWSVSLSNETEFRQGVWTFRDIRFHSGNSVLGIGGIISGNTANNFQLEFTDIDISHLDQLLGIPDLDVDGILNGKLVLNGQLSRLNYITDVSIDNLKLNQQELGILVAESHWDAADQAMIVDLELLKKGNIGLGKVITVNGYYFPGRKDQNFDMNIQLSNLGLAFLNPFINEIATLSRESLVSGLLRLTGTIEQPLVEGFLQLMRTQLRIDYLNTLYSLSGKIRVEKNSLDLNEITIHDIRGKSATCQGYITHNYFKDFFIDLQIIHNNFKVLSTTAKDNELFYGTGYSTGTFRITGPFDDLSMDLNIRTENGTSVKIPISTGISVMENDFIIFRGITTDTLTFEPPAEIRMKGLEVTINLQVDENASIELFLPYAMGTIEGTGHGDLGLYLNKRGDFSMFGDYVITQGKFYFTFENLFSREFDITQGSRISWQGDPYQGNIQLKAIHQVKTTLEGLPLQVDSASLTRERVDVLCIIYLENELMNPDIRFSVDFLNVPSSTKEIIYASLDTTDQSAMSQQILSLLLIGSFSYTNPSASLSSTSFRLLSNQLSNLLSRISKDFDIGIKYQPGTQLTEDELQVALRTQLFNNRLIIDGNFGVRGTSNTQNASNMVGDVNLEYKITPDGRFRIRAFNRSNIFNIIENYAPYTQGVGLSYRREFDSFSSIFSRKSRKNQKSAGADPRANREAIPETGIRWKE